MLAERSLPDITRDLVSHLGDLIQNEARLARAEAGENLRAASGGLFGLVFAAALGASAVTLGLFSLAYALAQQMPMWAGGLLAAAIGAVLAYVIFKNSKKALAPDTLALPKTAEQIARDARLVKEHLP